MSDKLFTVERGGSGHEWYVVAENGKRISMSEYKHEADHIADKLNVYLRLVEALQYFVNKCDTGMARSVKTYEKYKTLLTELGELEK